MYDMRAEGTPAAIFYEAKAMLVKEVNWNSMVEKSSESLEWQLATMVSEQCCKYLQRDKRRILLQGNKRMKYVEDSSVVENVSKSILRVLVGFAEKLLCKTLK